MIVNYGTKRWQCPRCNKWNYVRGVWKNGSLFKKCRCGRTTEIQVEVVKIYTLSYKIVGAREVIGRCERGTPKKVGDEKK